MLGIVSKDVGLQVSCGVGDIVSKDVGLQVSWGVGRVVLGRGRLLPPRRAGDVGLPRCSSGDPCLPSPGNLNQS